MLYRKKPTIAIVLAGGYGRRIHKVSERYGCKSLIPVDGKPLLAHVLSSLLSVHRGKIVVCVDREELLSTFESLIDDFNNKQLCLFNDSGPGSTIAIVREVSAWLGPSSMCTIYGHQPIPPSHFRRMLSLEDTTLGLSVYGSSSALTRKVLVSNGERILDVCGVSEDCYEKDTSYVAIPYMLPMKLVENTVGGKVNTLTTFSNWIKRGLPVKAISACLPHEFHREDELNLVRCYVNNQYGNLGIVSRKGLYSSKLTLTSHCSERVPQDTFSDER